MSRMACTKRVLSFSVRSPPLHQARAPLSRTIVCCGAPSCSTISPLHSHSSLAASYGLCSAHYAESSSSALTTMSTSNSLITGRPSQKRPQQYQIRRTSTILKSPWERKQINTVTPSTSLPSPLRLSTKSSLSKSTLSRINAPHLARAFHASRRNEVHPVIWVLGILKSSTALGATKMVARVFFSLVPVFLLKKFKILRWLRHTLHKQEYIEKHAPGKIGRMLDHLRKLNIALGALILVPIAMLFVTVLASLERTPITGRWRLILLSPEEEEVIAQNLEGEGWYSTVLQMLTEQSPDNRTSPNIVSGTDWRIRWVEQTMRRLEAAIPLMLDAEDRYSGLYNSYASADVDDSMTLPPPPSYPLVPRPRASQVIHSIPPSDDHFQPHSTPHPNPTSHHVAPHTLLGPPYSLLVVENPERNAFSYGFGANGGGGLVLYTGFIDEIMKLHCDNPLAKTTSPPPTTFWASLFGGLKSPSTSYPPTPPSPTSEQTAALATLLAHEISHLVLSHHLETLSSGTILLPTVSGMVTDFIRVILFPLTFLFGPFVGDAVADASRIGMGEFSKHGEACTSRDLELEADLVSIRLMSLAGFDPASAIRFWEGRLDDNGLLDADLLNATHAAAGGGVGGNGNSFWSPHMALDELNCEGGPPSHPVGAERVRRLREELARWQAEKERVRSSMMG